MYNADNFSALQSSSYFRSSPVHHPLHFYNNWRHFTEIPDYWRLSSASKKDMMNRTHPWYSSEWYDIWHTAVLQPRFTAAFSSFQCRFSPIFIYLFIVIIIFKGVRIWVKCTEAPVRRAPALSSAWFLIHLFVVVYACLLQSHDCVSMATRVWVIICVTTFIPLRKGEGEVRLSL